MAKLEDYFRRGDLSRARQRIKQRLERNADDIVAIVGRARIAMLRGRLGKAIDMLDVALQLDTNNAAARTYKAVALDLQGKSQAAEVLLRSALRIDPNFAAAHYNLARYHKRAGRLDEALAALETATRLEPDNPVYSLRVAELLLELDREAEAAPLLSALVSAFPRLAEGWLCVAGAQMRKGRAKEALRALANGLVYNPDDLALTLAAFQAAAHAQDFAFCAQAVLVTRQLVPTLGEVLDVVLHIIQAKDKELAQQLARSVAPSLVVEISNFLQPLADQAKPKRAEIINAAVEILCKKSPN